MAAGTPTSPAPKARGRATATTVSECGGSVVRPAAEPDPDGARDDGRRVVDVVVRVGRRPVEHGRVVRARPAAWPPSRTSQATDAVGSRLTRTRVTRGARLVDGGQLVDQRDVGARERLARGGARQHARAQQGGVHRQDVEGRAAHDAVGVDVERAAGVDRRRDVRHPHDVGVAQAGVEEARREEGVGHRVGAVDVVEVAGGDRARARCRPGGASRAGSTRRRRCRPGRRARRRRRSARARSMSACGPSERPTAVR